MFFCIPIFCEDPCPLGFVLLKASYTTLVGCQQKLKPEGDLTPRICPHCHNASVFSVKSTTWFEFFFIPLVPFSSKHVWFCQICRFVAPHAPGHWEPMVAYGGFPMQLPNHQPGYLNPNQPKSTPNPYQPAYLNSSMHQA
ncbi:hypothetical protein R3P38DRAFT_2955123 [Favolaschia claudopus]|uniref:Zinc-ribbon 15 domain-containing protein n=1 Tax=Favolaschia claudopus TaxID=2862362 RepID=A0AAW0BFT8_9AGAR